MSGTVLGTFYGLIYLISSKSEWEHWGTVRLITALRSQNKY